jgi:hypothetical protein
MTGLKESKAIEIKHPIFFGDFTQEEELVAKSILCSKAMSGLEVRLAKPEVFFLVEGNREMGIYIENARATLKYLVIANLRLLKEYASRLGISEQRYEEIRDYVYTKETSL